MNTDNLSARASIRIHKPAAVVFSAFAEAGAMSRFWFTRRDNGLREGESVTWYLGTANDAFAFEVEVLELRRDALIVIRWVGPDGNPTQVRWTFEETGEGDTILTIEETGFTGSPEAIVGRVIDSTGGFNQVIVAAKALVEHGVAVNVVAGHA